MKLLASIFTTMFLLISCSSNKVTKTGDEKRAEIYFTYGTEKLMKKDYAGGLDSLRKAYELEPESTKINNNLGLAYYLKGDIDMALKHFQESIKLDPKNSDARVNLASLYLAKGQKRLAKKTYQIVLKDLVYPSQFRVYYNLGLIFREEGKNKLAEAHFKRSIKEYSDYCPAYYQLGTLYLKKNKLKAATKTLEQGIRGKCYDKPASLYMLGEAYIKTGELISAKTRFEDLLQRFPRSPYAPEAAKKLKTLPGSEVEQMRVRNFYHQDKKKKQAYNDGVIN